MGGRRKAEAWVTRVRAFVPADRLQDGRAEGGEEALPNEGPALVEAGARLLHGVPGLLVRDERGRKVVAVDVVPVVVGVLVVRLG